MTSPDSINYNLTKLKPNTRTHSFVCILFCFFKEGSHEVVEWDQLNHPLRYAHPIGAQEGVLNSEEAVRPGTDTAHLQMEMK